MSYTICSIRIYSFCYAVCNLCKHSFCIGCLKELNNDNEDVNSSTCLKGYLKAFYLRIIYRRSSIGKANICYYIMHIIFCLFMTPLFLGFLSIIIGFFKHPNKNRKHELIDNSMMPFLLIYSIIRGLLMFPYIILFFPFMILLLLPGIFSYNYYLYIFIMYVTAFFAGPDSLNNVGI